MAIEVFNRYENKYRVPENLVFGLQNRLSDFMELDAYNKSRETYTIANLYYDTNDSHLIRTSLAKPGYKEKLRLRAYGAPEPDSQVYIEIKKKVAGLVNKRRSGINLDKAYKFLESGILPEFDGHMNPQVLREAAYILEQHKLKPAVYLAYDRRAYFGLGQHDLRVSFDVNIRTRRENLRLEAGTDGENLLEAGVWLMEIKSAQSIPVWLTKLLSEYKIYPSGFSKYGEEYKHMLAAEPRAKSALPESLAALLPSGLPVPA